MLAARHGTHAQCLSVPNHAVRNCIMESDGTTARTRRRSDPQAGELAGEVKRSEYRTDESREAAIRILTVHDQRFCKLPNSSLLHHYESVLL